jgi:hypothetical protein
MPLSGICRYDGGFMVPFEENSPPRVAFINRLRNSSMNISIMSIDEESLKQFLDYKKSKIDSIKNIESGRLSDLKDGRSTVFKYALPTSIIGSAVGVFASLKTPLGIWILLPITFFLVLVYFLADNLDRKKYAERVEIMKYTEDSLQEILEQEIELLGKVSQGN